MGMTATITMGQSNMKDLRKKAAELVAQMTLEEKASLTSGRDAWSTKPIDRLDIPFIWMSDGPHGLRRAPETHLWGYGDQLPSICFPTASALAASWDVALLNEVGKALGREAKSQNVNILLGPGVNIKRSVLGGRNFEYFSEDPILSGELGAAYINGVQSVGVGTSLKHYVANNVETNRMYINSVVDTRTLNEIYLTPFEIAVKKADPWTVMACYNRVQGVYGTESVELLTNILRNDWGFQGMVVSDWDAVLDRIAGIKAGMNVQMPGPNVAYTDQLIVEAVKSGELNEEELDRVVEDVVFTILRAQKANNSKNDFDKEEQHQFARKVAGETLTLLKNENEVLPISTKKYKKVAIIGEFAKAPRYQGNGSSEVKPTQLDAAYDMIQSLYGKDVEISYAQGYNLKNDDDTSLIAEAVKVAEEADIALIFAGLPLHYESEGIDRTHINIPGAQEALISAVGKEQKNTAVVLTNGSAIAMPWIDEVPAVLETWLVGQAGAGAIADVLFGKINPSGKLAESFPKKLEDTPAFLNFPGEEGDVLYGERMFVGYRYYDTRKIEPLFPFGHGLSYTSYEYSDIKVSSNNPTSQNGLEVAFKVTNTGKVAGKEIVQLYVSDKESSLQRPKQELKKFAKIELNPGETKEVSFKLNQRDFSYYDSKRAMWICESGDFKIHVGASSRDIRLSEKINMTSTQNIPMAIDEYTFIQELLDNPQTKQMLLDFVPKWLKSNLPEGKSLEEVELNGFIAYQPIKKLPIFTGGEVSEQDVLEFVEKCKNLIK